MRLAWFSPVPPVRTGVATVSAELVSALSRADGLEIDVFVDEPVARAMGEHPVRAVSAHDFVWRHRQAPYDLTVYHLGNSSHHDYQWPYLFRYPGLAVLHDVHLHHARAAALLRERRPRDYRAEFAASQPRTSPDAAELAVAGFDSYLYYGWPFTRLVCAASRVTAVHSRLMREALRDELPEARVECVRLGHGAPVADDGAAQARVAVRTRYGIPFDAILFGCFGGLTPDKRIPQILAALDAMPGDAAKVRLLLAGGTASHYDVAADVSARLLDRRVTITGYLETDEELTAHIAACDVTLNLRWPTAREVSGPWLRCLAAGKPTVVIDLAHLADVPALDPRTWTPTLAGDAAPVAVALDITDEDHSLYLAMRRLARDGALRAALGSAARAWWQAEHSVEAMLDDYRRLLPHAARTAVPALTLPPHLTDDASGLLSAILDRFEVAVPWSRL